MSTLLVSLIAQAVTEAAKKKRPPIVAYLSKTIEFDAGTLHRGQTGTIQYLGRRKVLGFAVDRDPDPTNKGQDMVYPAGFSIGDCSREWEQFLHIPSLGIYRR